MLLLSSAPGFYSPSEALSSDWLLVSPPPSCLRLHVYEQRNTGEEQLLLQVGPVAGGPHNTAFIMMEKGEKCVLLFYSDLALRIRLYCNRKQHNCPKNVSYCIVS